MSGTINPPSSAPNESKSARKKKAKAEAAAAAAAAAPSSPIKDASSPVDGSVNGADVESEHPVIKELQKKLRNVNKKLNAMDKLNAVLKENPNVALDDLVAQKKINNDQKAQALKKPQLEADREQFEEQLAQYKKVNDDHQKMLKGQREQLEAAHAEKLKEVERTAQATAEAKAEEATKERLLTFSKFLRAAAARRQECDDDSELSRAFEGALLQVYGGNPEAVEAALKLIAGSTEPVLSTEGIALTITYAEVKESSIKDIEFADQKAWAEEVAQSEPVPPASNAAASAETGTDPTVAHAGLTEIDDSVAATNGDSHDESPAPAATSVEDSSANAAGAEQWDSKVPVADDPLTESFEMVPRNPSETEAIHQPAPAASTQSWAEDTPALSAPETPAPVTKGAPAPNGEGFQEVAHARGGRGRGGFQGERGRGGYRGRGQGRGRGGNFHRGDRGRGGNGLRGGRGRDQAQPSA